MPNERTRTVIVTYMMPATAHIRLDIEDGKHTKKEIREMVEREIGNTITPDAEDICWDWDGAAPATRPDPLENPEPPEHCWHTVSDHHCAINAGVDGAMGLMLKSCPIRPIWPQRWLEELPEDAAKVLAKLLNEDWRALPIHHGFFDKVLVREFRAIDAVCRGAGPHTPGYFALGENLLAIIMPIQMNVPTADVGETCERFHPVALVRE